jgi:protein O-mannosyl-transferase
VPRKSRHRKSEARRSSEALAVPDALAAHKPWQIAAVCIFLAAVTFIAYQSVRNNDFLRYDDDFYVLLNRHVQQGLNLHSIGWAFTTFDQGNWHPLTWISHMVDWDLYGKSPVGHHMTNVFWHAANAVLLFLLILYMTGYLGRAAMVAFLFALHPAHVESVAWIAERKDLLCGFFWLATTLAYVWYLRSPSRKRYIWVICCYAGALLSKPMAVTLPFTLLLLDYWPLRRLTFTAETGAKRLSSLLKLCVEKWPLFIMAAGSCVITFIAQRAGGAVDSLQELALWERLCNVAISYWRYVEIIFWPNPLAAYYFYDYRHLSILATILSASALILVSAACWHFRKQRPYCLIGWLWFLGTLIPVIGFVQVGGQAMAERYTYIPSIGLFITVVWLVGDAAVKFPRVKLVAQLLAVVVIAACAVKTAAQVKLWKDTVTLFNHVLEVDPRGEFANSMLAGEYMRLGRLVEAEKYYELSLVYDPDWEMTLTNSAFCLMRIEMQTHDKHYLQLAKQRLDKVLSMDANDPGALTNLALWSALMGQPKDEETYCRRLIAANPSNVAARLYLGDALQAQNKLDESGQQYRSVLSVVPDSYDAHNDLGTVLNKQGLERDAIKEFRISLSINPNQSAPHTKIGRIMVQTNQISQAVEEFIQAARISPGDANAHNDLAVTLLQLGEYERAAEQFRAVLQIDPTFADATGNLEFAEAHRQNKMVENRR